MREMCTPGSVCMLPTPRNDHTETRARSEPEISSRCGRHGHPAGRRGKGQKAVGRHMSARARTLAGVRGHAYRQNQLLPRPTRYESVPRFGSVPRHENNVWRREGGERRPLLLFETCPTAGKLVTRRAVLSSTPPSQPWAPRTPRQRRYLAGRPRSASSRQRRPAGRPAGPARCHM